MQETYRGFFIEATKEECLAGHEMLYYSVYDKEGHEMIASFEDSEETISDKIKQLKECIDDMIENPGNWYEDD